MMDKLLLRRFGTKAVIGLLAGLLCTAVSSMLVVAAADVGTSQSSEPIRAVRPGWLPAAWPDAGSAERWRGTSIGYFYSKVKFPIASQAGSDLTDTYSLHRMAFGWPLPALVRYYAGVYHSPHSLRGEPLRAFFSDFERSAGLRTGIRAPGWFPRDTSLGYEIPVWPILSGWAFNTAFYGAPIFVLCTAPGVLRRRARRKRGACPACGYDLKGTRGRPCPECGALPQADEKAPGRAGGLSSVSR